MMYKTQHPCPKCQQACAKCCKSVLYLDVVGFTGDREVQVRAFCGECGYEKTWEEAIHLSEMVDSSGWG